MAGTRLRAPAPECGEGQFTRVSRRAPAPLAALVHMAGICRIIGTREVTDDG